MKKALPALAAALLLASCGSVVAAPAGNRTAAEPTPAATATARATTVGRTIAPWDATRCGDDNYRNARMERHPALMGRTPDALRAAFGSVTTQETFRVGEPAGPFYGELGSRRSGLRHPQAGQPAQVLTWTKQGCNFSAFFVEQGGTWRAVNAFEWAVGADF